MPDKVTSLPLDNVLINTAGTRGNGRSGSDMIGVVLATMALPKGTIVLRTMSMLVPREMIVLKARNMLRTVKYCMLSMSKIFFWLVEKKFLLFKGKIKREKEERNEGWLFIDGFAARLAINRDEGGEVNFVAFTIGDVTWFVYTSLAKIYAIFMSDYEQL